MTYPAPYPICPRCQTLVDPDTTRISTGSHLWHVKCHRAYERDREWLTEAEVMGAVE